MYVEYVCNVCMYGVCACAAKDGRICSVELPSRAVTNPFCSEGMIIIKNDDNNNSNIQKRFIAVYSKTNKIFRDG